MHLPGTVLYMLIACSMEPPPVRRWRWSPARCGITTRGTWPQHIFGFLLCGWCGGNFYPSRIFQDTLPCCDAITPPATQQPILPNTNRRLCKPRAHAHHRRRDNAVECVRVCRRQGRLLIAALRGNLRIWREKSGADKVTRPCSKEKLNHCWERLDKIDIVVVVCFDLLPHYLSGGFYLVFMACRHGGALPYMSVSQASWPGLFWKIPVSQSAHALILWLGTGFFKLYALHMKLLTMWGWRQLPPPYLADHLSWSYHY